MDIENILIDRNISYTRTGEHFLIRCLSPEHEDKHPSMRVNSATGFAFCFSCNHKINLLKEFNLPLSKLQIKRDKFQELLTRKRMENVNYEFPNNITFWEDTYRGIDKDTYKHFEAFQYGEYPGYIFFPIKNFAGKNINFLGRDTTNLHKNKYTFLYKNSCIFYPIPKLYNGSLILVEGIFDAINLYDKGLKNVSAVLGANKVTEETFKRLLVFDLKELVTFYDPDKAGQEAVQKVKEICENNLIKHKNVNYGNEKDPGDLNKQEVNKLREGLYGKSSNN